MILILVKLFEDKILVVLLVLVYFIKDIVNINVVIEWLIYFIIIF